MTEARFWSVMPTVVFIFSDGRRTVVRAREGVSLVEVALRYSIDEIEAKCRGDCACVTRRVHIGSRWRPMIGSPTLDDQVGGAAATNFRKAIACVP